MCDTRRRYQDACAKQVILGNKQTPWQDPGRPLDRAHMLVGNQDWNAGAFKHRLD
jgi:hypothetical protein